MNRSLSSAEAQTATAHTSPGGGEPAREAFPRKSATDGIVSADVALFDSLLMPTMPVECHAPTTAHGETRPSTAKPSAFLYQQSDTPPLERLEEQVGERLGACGRAIECTLLLPRLGEVQLSAGLHRDEWHIDLTFLQAPARAHARRQHAHLADRLGQRLGRPVVLGLHLRGEDERDD
ncbi:type III secretion system HrpP C-terminal domain-containing protein [Halomonas sp. MCCC 1A11057]|uniref:type III secretion system HrpP C-terminal domain-containing protein n=1 Tax=Halomonas sp. MCCC 1A11057 TaxID=2733482 RepID=UPI001F39FB80|nr:type III secretion system HrpP C-terminal domain-containing protein [Halomonas sp. MCCC 1A11057]MCE8032144.1 hypothetical protein [Halomonas sp. MCCC 1A11057]